MIYVEFDSSQIEIKLFSLSTYLLILSFTWGTLHLKCNYKCKVVIVFNPAACRVNLLQSDIEGVSTQNACVTYVWEFLVTLTMLFERTLRGSKRCQNVKRLKLPFLVSDEDTTSSHGLERGPQHLDGYRHLPLHRCRVLRVPQVRRGRVGEHHPQSASGPVVSCLILVDKG